MPGVTGAAAGAGGVVWGWREEKRTASQRCWLVQIGRRSGRGICDEWNTAPLGNGIWRCEPDE